jgi:rhamnulokinase
LYQLYALALEHSPALDMADTLLMMPDLLNYWLTGVKLCEFSIATTTQFYDPVRKGWATDLLDKLGLPARIMPRIIPPATELGPLLPALADQLGVRGLRVIAPACHDTGSAVAAVPARVDHFAYISSGTWSLMGTVSPEPVINDLTLEYNFTNEGGVGGTFRLLKNITGLWLVQQCRQAWARAGSEQSYDAITALAEAAQPFQSFVDPDHGSFLNPSDMPQAIQAFCAATGQPVPTERGALARTALESLACKYRVTLEQLERIAGHRLEAIHIVGGGSQNRLLCQFTADVCGRPVYAGPVEATALGNVLAQAVATGHCGSWDEAREIVRAAFPLIEYAPRDTAAWEQAFIHFQQILNA